ncbi:MAG TPA: Omp28-related outer membrane protein [Bacteroidia bacterium]|jgi:thiol-disulfide isomerase/thioredoxin|nr:Omp28-related outer membrane protein [Bacteroidia bacterium]
MKKIILLFIIYFGLNINASAQTFSDDFEKDTLGLLGPQSNEWRTWSGLGGGADDVNVVDTDNHTTSGKKSIYFFSKDKSGGPSDVILPFGSAPLNTGHFTFKSWFKIPSGKNAYFNFQGTAKFGELFTLDAFLDATGKISIQSKGQEAINTDYPVGKWFELTIDANLNSNDWSLLIDGVSKGTWKNGSTDVYAIDIYPTDASAEFWLDDVSYTVIPYTLPNLNAAANLLNIPRGLVGQSNPVSLTVRNLGKAVITSFDVTIVQNGGTPIKQNVTGVNISSLASYIVNITTPFTLAAGANDFTATVNNINGAGPDGDTSDDVTTQSVNGVKPALGKVIVGEEATGTWCQWCPRGAVFMDLLSKKYKNNFIGIAVHNNDPLTLIPYDSAFTKLISSFPSASTDRTTVIDPSALEDNFLKRIIVEPAGVLVNGALFDANTRELKVSITTTLKQNISGNYKLAFVLTEDSVSGTAKGYNQANAYAGGSYGEMGGYELLPNPVPAAKMNYDHVARVLAPGFDGLANAFGTSALAGKVMTHNFKYVLPADWDANQIHIIGLFINPEGKIENAGSATIKEAIKNGYIDGTTVGIQTTIAGPDAIHLVPNPAREFSSVSIDLKTETLVSIEVYAASGVLVSSKEYGKLSGSYYLPIETNLLSEGLYFVRINLNNRPTVLKLIKQ